jgi:uncharacterized protein YjiS (DUF1127 family)
MSILLDEIPTVRRGTPGWRRGGVSQSGSWSARVAPSGLIALWAARRRQRLTLAELCQQPHLLDDLGLTPAQARGEARKPFWRP